jgi:2-oxoglutarate ferredoxin oxidoreductase subunit beta
VSELFSGLPGAKYIERVAVSSPKEVLKTKKAIRQAFQNQIDNIGFSLVEVLSMCPTCWGMTPEKSVKWIEEDMVRAFPLGRIK